jgi:OPA family glycerol-3-phosphate transporter-like MFS transporter
MGIYFLEVVVILIAAQARSTGAIAAAFVTIAFTANSTHSLLGPAAAMDIGGRKMAGFASGVIDSFQYFGAGLALKLLGWLLDKNWDYYFYFMAPFGVLGGILMWTISHRRSLKKGDTH